MGMKDFGISFDSMIDSAEKGEGSESPKVTDSSERIRNCNTDCNFALIYKKNLRSW
jgi:hypothetical protein